MAFYTDTTSAPHIIDDTNYQHQQLSMINTSDQVTTWSRLVTTIRSRHVWLTRAAADSIAAAKQAETGKSAQSVRMNDAGAYQVRVTQRTIGAWSS